MFKKLVVNACCVAMVASMCVSTALAVDYSRYGFDPSNADVSTRAEESEWLLKIFDGVLHKRQWSITYGIWLTDWIPVPGIGQ